MSSAESARTRRAPDAPTGRLAAAWLVLTLVPVHNVIQRANVDAVSQVGLEPVFELGYFAVCGLLAVSVLATLERRPETARPPVLLLALPAWFVVSGLWSDTVAYAVVRGSQMGVVAVLGWATIAVGRVDPERVEGIVAVYLRWLVRITIVLAALGLVFGPVRVPASDEALGRFTWIGAHPNGSGLVLALAVTVLVAAPTAALRITPGVRAVAIAAGLLLLFENQSRTSWASLAAGSAAAGVAVAVRHPRVRLVLPLAAAVVAGTAVALFGPISDYFLRGQRPSSLASGNGRLSLWPIGADALTTPFDWLCGLGYGAARTVFVAEKAWAKTAHSSILAVLVSGGILAVLLLAALVVSTVRALLRADLVRRSPHGMVIPALLTVVLVNGLASDVVAEPNIGFTVLALTYSVAVVAARSVASVSAAGPARAPAPTRGR